MRWKNEQNKGVIGKQGGKDVEQIIIKAVSSSFLSQIAVLHALFKRGRLCSNRRLWAHVLLGFALAAGSQASETST